MKLLTKKLLENKAAMKRLGYDNDHFIKTETVVDVLDVKIQRVHR